jgi:hypothetical protein
MHYVDIDYYPIERGRTLTWFNEDFVEHRLHIFEPDGATIAESGPEQPEVRVLIMTNINLNYFG